MIVYLNSFSKYVDNHDNNDFITFLGMKGNKIYGLYSKKC